MSEFPPQNVKSQHQNVMVNLPVDAHARKGIPVMTGVLDYFPSAIAEVAKLSKVGNDQHNPGQPLHWARHKSTDQADTIVRHLMQRGTIDTDGVRHSTKAAWRALALLQEELEHEAGFVPELPKNGPATRNLEIKNGKLTLPNGHYIEHPQFIDYNDGAGLQLCGGTEYTADGKPYGIIGPPGHRGVAGVKGE